MNIANTTGQDVPPPVSLSANAAKRIAVLKQKEGNDDLKFKVRVDGGGCSGFQYHFSFVETAENDDIVVVKDGVTMLVDSLSLLYMTGSEVDFVEDLVGAAFVVKNPNATASCGCGTSFSI
ncbi:MAG: iron-sulfur cluster insertion protein ErpA [Kordiimonas sp.]|nr:iron-sulfur cluster insertion protein ErpA [Kordiimonas sp.]